MPFLADRNYASNADVFLQELKKEHPDMQRAQEQHFAEALAHRVDFDMEKSFAKAQVEQAAYVYQTKDS